MKLKQRLENRPSEDQLKAVFPNIFTPRSPPPYRSPKKAQQVIYHNASNEEEIYSRSVQRTRYAIALKAAARLASSGQISHEEKGVLKELILDHDKRIFGAIEVYELDRDAAELLDSLYRVVKLSH